MLFLHLQYLQVQRKCLFILLEIVHFKLLFLDNCNYRFRSLMKIDLLQETSLLIHKNFLKTKHALGIRLFSNDLQDRPSKELYKRASHRELNCCKTIRPVITLHPETESVSRCSEEQMHSLDVCDECIACNIVDNCKSFCKSQG